MANKVRKKIIIDEMTRQSMGNTSKTTSSKKKKGLLDYDEKNSFSIKSRKKQIKGIRKRNDDIMKNLFVD